MFNQAFTPPPGFDAEAIAAQTQTQNETNERNERPAVSFLAQLKDFLWSWQPWPISHPRAQKYAYARQSRS